MSIVHVNGVQLYYEMQGEGEPLVLVVGFGGDLSTWAGIRVSLAKHYRVILFDNRGVGRSEVPDGPYSIEQMAQDTRALCEYLNIQSAYFMGNSMGGHIVQMLAYQYPSLVKKAVISNSVMNPKVPFRVFAEGKLELIKAGAPLSAIVKISCSQGFSYQFLSQPGQMEKLIELAKNNPYPFNIRGYEGQSAALNAFNSTEWAHKISVPVLVMGADQDLIFREELVRALAAAIPGAQYHSFKNCGHIPYLEYPEEFVQTMVEFFC